MKRILRKVITPFLPKYEVICTSYQIIPGQPVNRNESRHSFKRGTATEAKDFYGKVVSSEFTRTMAPVEVQLRRIYLMGRTIEKAEFGPVSTLKNLHKPKKK